MPSDILIQPNRGSTTLNPIIFFSGSAANNSIRLETLPSGSVAFLGRSGSLFSIVDSISGSLMAVSDVSGLPILEVFSDDRVVMGKFNTNALVVTGSRIGVGISAPNAPLHVRGQSGGGDVTLKLQEFGSNTWTIGSGGRFYISKNDGTVMFSIGDSVAPNGYLNIKSDGNVGVGTSTPNYKIHAYTASETTIAIETASRKWGIITNTSWSGNGFSIYDLTADSSRVLVDTTGNVGVGKNSGINAKLDVNGNTIISGSLIVTGDVQADFTPMFLLMGA